MAKDCIDITSGSKSSTPLYSWDSCLEGSKLLACAAYCPTVRGVPNLAPPSPEEDNNIIAALKQSARVSTISLTATSSLIEKLSTTSEPLSELQELALLSKTMCS